MSPLSNKCQRELLISVSGIDDGVPKSDQVVSASNSPWSGRRAEKLEQPALICP